MGASQWAAMESLRGKLLLSAPNLFDPNFRRTVVLIAEHNEDGALGLVLNRPAGMTVAEAVPELAWIAGSDDDPVYAGGPVGADSVIVLAEFDDPSLAAAIVMDDLGFVPPTRSAASGWPTRRGARGSSPATPAGVPASSTTSSPRTPGSSSRRRSMTSSPPIPSACGARCCAARAANGG